MLNKGIQDFFINAGDAACYVFCLFKLAEREYAKKGINKHFDIVQEIENGIKKSYIYYNFKNGKDEKNFFVNRPDLFLSMLLGGKKVCVRIEGAEYKPMANELCVNYWKRRTPKKVYGHFTLPDWDSLLDSQTVKYGKIISKRIFTIN